MYFFEIKRPPPPTTAEELKSRLIERRKTWARLYVEFYSTLENDCEMAVTEDGDVISLSKDPDTKVLLESYAKNHPVLHDISFFLSLIV